MILTFKYDSEKNEFHQVGWSHSPQTYFKMMGWLVPDDHYIRNVTESGKLFYHEHEFEGSVGNYHWQKEGLIAELKEKGVIS